MDDEFQTGNFDVDSYLERQEQSFISEFGWPDASDESYTGEEGEGESW